MKLVGQASNCTRALVKLSVNDPFRPYLLEVVLERLPLRLRHRRDVAQSHAIWRGHRALVLTLFKYKTNCHLQGKRAVSRTRSTSQTSSGRTEHEAAPEARDWRKLAGRPMM